MHPKIMHVYYNIIIAIFESNQEHSPNTDVCMNADHNHMKYIHYNTLYVNVNMPILIIVGITL